jgi:hypothetical protein
MAIRLTVFLFVLISLFTSCGDCNCCLVDCAPSVFFDLRIDDEQTFNTLLRESDSLYHVSEMSITSVVDGQQIEGFLFRSNTGTNDSLPIYCWSNVEPSLMFLKLNQDDTDTLSFVSQYNEGECCNGYSLDSVSINGEPMIAVLNNIITIYK